MWTWMGSAAGVPLGDEGGAAVGSSSGAGARGSSSIADCLGPSLAGGAGGRSRSNRSAWPKAGATVAAPPPQVTVWTCTYNVAGRMPTTADEHELTGWISADCPGAASSPADIIVFGLQELDTSPLAVVLPTVMTNSEEKEAAWRKSILTCIPKGYKQVRVRVRVCSNTGPPLLVQKVQKRACSTHRLNKNVERVRR